MTAPVDTSVSVMKAAPPTSGEAGGAEASTKTLSASTLPACAVTSRVSSVLVLPPPAPEVTYAKGLALVMDAPTLSDATMLKGPAARSGGAAVKPPRPPGPTSAVMQR